MVNGRYELIVPGRSIKIHHDGWKRIVEVEIKRSPCRPPTTVRGAGRYRKQIVFEVCFENLHPWELGLLS